MASSAQPGIAAAEPAWGMDRAAPEAAEKLGQLEARLKELGSLMVAYSGGVDSAFLAATAHRVLEIGRAHV